MRRQCDKCPWRVDVDPYDIPNGYSRKKHAALKSTIAVPGEIRLGGKLPMMACHESEPVEEVPCVGWLANQIGPGNNIALRIAALRDRSLTDYELVGEQHPTLAATVPRGGSRCD